MLKKFKEHCGRPITWGKYYKLCGISFLLSFVFGMLYAGVCILKVKLNFSRF